MPTYGYKCEKCKKRIEVVQKMTDSPLKRCSSCKGKLVRVLFPAGVIYKADGFYTTETRKQKEQKEKKAETAAAAPEKSGKKDEKKEVDMEKEKALA